MHEKARLCWLLEAWAPTASAAVLLFLLTGQDANNLVQDEDPKISEAKKKALIGYIQDKLQEVTNRQAEINQVLSGI